MLTEYVRLLEAARQALRSYQYGNAATELAEEVADRIDVWLSGEGADKREGRE